MSLKWDFPTVCVWVDSQNVYLDGYGTHSKTQCFSQQLVNRYIELFLVHTFMFTCHHVGMSFLLHWFFCELFKAQSDIYTDLLKWNGKMQICFSLNIMSQKINSTVVFIYSWSLGIIIIIIHKERMYFSALAQSCMLEDRNIFIIEIR